MKVLVAILSVLCVAGMAGANLVAIPMNAQINVGLGDAIYGPGAPDFPPNELSFQPPDAPGAPLGFTRVDINRVPGSWYYGPYIDFRKAGIGDINITSADLRVDMRVYQGPSNTNRYGDANAFFRAYTLKPDGSYQGHRDYGIIYGPNAGVWPFGNWYPAWGHKTMALNNAALQPFTDSDPDLSPFDPTKVARVRFYGTDWSSGGDDFLDVANFFITPEPASLALLALGGLALIRRR